MAISMSVASLAASRSTAPTTSVRPRRHLAATRVSKCKACDVVRAVNVKGNLELKGRGNDIDFEKVAGSVTVDGSWSGLVQLRELAKPIRWKVRRRKSPRRVFRANCA